MIRIAIVEDDPACRSQLQGYLHHYETEHGVAFQISVFENGHDIAYRYSADYDIILMDIELGAVSGMDAAEIIRSMRSAGILWRPLIMCSSRFPILRFPNV